MTQKNPVVMFYVQHLLGIGHVFRATRIARALANDGFEVHVAWGGTKIPSINLDGLNMTWLTPARVKDEDFKTLLHADFTPFTDEDKQARKDQLLNLFNQVKPDVVITEAFPFGRRLMRFELLPLLEAAANADWKPIKAASIRDIMQEDRAEKRVRESLDHIHNDYDVVLVHGDPNLIPIEATLQGATEIADKIRYTGLVTPEAPEKIDLNDAPDVLISVGGGAVGRNLARAAVHAVELSKKFPTNWLLTTGPDLPQSEREYLKTHKTDAIKIVDFIPNLAATMASGKVSVSLSGYNTVGDLLRAGTRAVLVPFTEGLETEQLRRATIMEEKGLARVILPKALTPQLLAKTIDNAAELEPASVKLDMDGAQNTAQILRDILNSR